MIRRRGVRRRRFMFLVLVVLTASTTVFSGASFTSRSTNDGNSFSAKADWVAPTSTASSPATVSSPTFTVTYTSGDAGSGVASVELWVKRPGDGSYSLADTDNSPGSPSFSYTPAAGDGAYSFYTRASDAANNYEAAPGSADTTTASQLERHDGSVVRRPRSPTYANSDSRSPTRRPTAQAAPASTRSSYG